MADNPVDPIQISTPVEDLLTPEELSSRVTAEFIGNAMYAQERQAAIDSENAIRLANAANAEAEMRRNVVEANSIIGDTGNTVQSMALETHKPFGDLEPPPGYDTAEQVESAITGPGEPVNLWATKALGTASPEFLDRQIYLMDTAAQGTITGMAVNMAMPKYDQEKEDKLGFGDKLTRSMYSLGMDLPYVIMGGGIPYYGSKLMEAGAQVVPFLVGKAPVMGEAAYMMWQGASGMGFHSGLRQLYMDTVAKGEITTKQEWIERMGSTLKGTAEGMVIGAVGGGSGYLRQGVASMPGKAGMLAAEGASIATIQANMENPGTLPGKEDFAMAIAQTFGMSMAFGAWDMYLKNPSPVANFNKKLMEQVVGRDNTSWNDDVKDFATDNKWYSNKFESAYVNYGQHPGQLAHDLANKVSVMEDVSDPTTLNIRTYDKASGAPLPERPGESVFKEIETIHNESKSLHVPVEPPTTVTEGTPSAKPLNSFNPDPSFSSIFQGPVPLGVLNPLEIGHTTNYQVVKAGDSHIALPIDREYSMAYTPLSRLKNPAMVVATLEITKGLFPVHKMLDFGVAGQFSPAEIGRQMRLDMYDSKIRKLNRVIKDEQSKGFTAQESILALQTLSGERASLAASDLSPHEMEVAVSRSITKGQEDPTGLRPPIESGKTPEQIKGRILLTLTHEVGHMIDYVNQGWEGGQSEIMKPLIGRFKAFANTSNNFQTHILSLTDKIKIQEEARALSMMWRPVSEDAFLNSQYRMMPAEIMADVNSAILNNPDIAGMVAPTLVKNWETYLANRPSERAIVDDLIGDLNGHNSLDKAQEMLAGDTHGFGKAEAIRKQADLYDASALTGQIHSIWDSVATTFFDSAHGALKYTKANDEVRNTLERYQHVGTIQHNYMSKILNDFVSPMKELGFDNKDIGLLLFYNRMMNDSSRQMLVNSFGFDKETSQVQFDKMFDTLDKKVFGESALEKFYKIRQDNVIKLAEDSGLFSDNALDKFRDNREYAKLELVKYFEDKIVRRGKEVSGMGESVIHTTDVGSRYEQIGSFEGIVNPLATTLENDLALIKHIHRQVAIRDVIKEMEATGGPVIPGSLWNPSSSAVLDPAVSTIHDTMLKRLNVRESDMVKISFAQRVLNDETGRYETKPVDYYVPTSVRDVFTGSPEIVNMYHKLVSVPFENVKGIGPSSLVGAAKTVDYSTNFFRYMAVVMNAGFHTANLTYDAGRTYFNAPLVEGKYVQSFIPLALTYKHYLEAFKSQWSSRVNGVNDPIWEEMLQKGMVTAGVRYGEDISGGDLADRLMGKYTTANAREDNIGFSYEGMKNAGRKLVEGVQNVLEFAEGMNNEVGYRYLKENQQNLVTYKDGQKRVGMTDAEIEHYSRANLGSPAYRRRGKLTTLTNTLIPFSNTFKEGLRGDVESFNNNRQAAIAKMSMAVMLPIAFQTLAELGLFDSKEAADVQGGKWSDIYATQSEFTKSTGLVVPIYLNTKEDKGLVTRLPLPQNPMIRTVAATTRMAIKTFHEMAVGGDTEAQKVIDSMLQLSTQVVTGLSGDMPTWGPFAKLPSLVKDIPFGENAPGTMKGNDQGYFNDQEMARMNTDDLWTNTKNRVKGGVRYMADIHAVPSISRMLKDNAEPIGMLQSYDAIRNAPPDADLPYYAKHAAELVGAPLGYGFSGYFKYGNGGIKEQMHIAQVKDKQEATSRQIRAEDNYDKMISTGDLEGTVFNNAKDIAKLKDVIKKRTIDGVPDPYVKLYLQAKGTRQKEYAIKRLMSVSEDRMEN
jgi:hypothetical protein